MRKLKKVLAGILSAAMMMTTMTMTAFAAQTTTPAVIDPELKGSLTIHKFEYNGEETLPGTGAEDNAVPEGANPLAGAGFTIYKVVDLDGMTQYYNTNPTTLPSVDTYVENGAIKSGYADKQVGVEIITGTNGLAEFKNLELGFYVVVETTKPDAVTDAVDPFIVSVPMTTVNGADWLYDVHVFPKNGTKYGEIKLEKSGEGTEKLAGVTFVLQKQNGDTWTNITKKAGAAGDNTGADLNLVTSASGLISVDGLTQGTYRFIETSVGNNDGYIMDGAATYEFTVNADGTVTYGDETAASVTIAVDNEKPDMTKEVKDRVDNTWGQDADYNVGDKVPYKVSVEVPANITQLKEFNLKDTPVNLKDDVDTIVVKDGETVVPANANVYTAVEDGNGFVITFNPANMGAYADKKLTVEYEAELLDKAVVTTAGNPNTATLEYSNKILPGTDDGSNPNKPGTPDKDVIKDNAIVYTFKLTVNKVNEANQPLKDVEFDLYKEVPQGTAGAELGNADNGLDKTRYWLKLGTLKTDEKGVVSKEGLANGDYYLVETKTNDGYNLLKEPVKVTLAVQYVTSMEESWEWEVVDGVKTLVKHKITSEKTTFTNDTNATDNTGEQVQKIVNKKGFTLPTTGGMGTLMFSIIGAILMIGGAIVLFRSSKKRAA